MVAERGTATRPHRTWPERLLLALGVVLVVGFAGTAVGVAYGVWKFGQVDTYDLALPDVASGDPANFLIVGSDSRESVASDDPNSGAFLEGESAGRRSDTILILRVDPKKESATMVSLPRDLWVPIAGTDGSQRINAAYAKGEQVLADTIQQYLGIPVNHYIEVDFNGFQQLVSAVDGVPLYFERAMKDTNSGLDVLHPGCVTLDGPSALAFARSRHLEYMLDGVYQTDPTGDLGRITRQQLLIRHAISRAVSKGLTNPLTLKRLVDVGVSNIGIDDELTPVELLALGRRFASFDSNELATYTLPVTDFVTDGGAKVLALDEEDAAPVLDLFRPAGFERETTDEGPLTEADVSVRVLNGASVEKRATNVAGALERAGFGVSEIGDVEDIGRSDVDHSEVLYAPGDQEAAELVGRHLRAGASLVEDADVEAGSIVLIAGHDFTTVTAAAMANVPGEPPTTAAPSTTTTTSPPTTPTTAAPIGRSPEDPPPGVTCG
jgi:polyisoprenyl-teichoic acid--peptidoglycan teichoic acid transferase